MAGEPKSTGVIMGAVAGVTAEKKISTFMQKAEVEEEVKAEPEQIQLEEEEEQREIVPEEVKGVEEDDLEEIPMDEEMKKEMIKMVQETISPVNPLDDSFSVLSKEI